MHPLLKCLAFDVFSDVIQKPASAFWFQHFQHMRIVDAFACPLFVQKAINVFRVVFKIYRRSFNDDSVISFSVQRQIDLGAIGGVHLSEDFIAVNDLTVWVITKS